MDKPENNSEGDSREKRRDNGFRHETVGKFIIHAHKLVVLSPLEKDNLIVVDDSSDDSVSIRTKIEQLTKL